ncbi:E3 ubiquitin-protein ligase TRIM33-like isoform X1 [Mercenaria mercenaria]|uniref:E3 ubiquitin-protein ligase TRIM33-like isoform X1 n=1 Tax=Mercenaria mercenaria TaxID=6596 RepID=UPI00234E9110|nr:E3 ubiquitin-protein ligase TRIM33-like isoform X1 [Mercenaria mercenaria]
MEVSGKRTKMPQLTSSFSKGSSEDFDFFCEPCASESTHVEANGYCKNCEEFLCSTCFASHRRVRLTKNHILLDKSSMPKQQKSVNKESDCKVNCTKHPKEIIIYFCASHDEVGCHICMSSKHSKCVNEYIPDIADGTKDGSEYKDLLKELDDIEIEAVRKETKATTNKQITEQSYSAAIRSICEFRKDINADLDQLQHILSEEAMQVKKEEEMSMDSIIKECHLIMKNASTYKNEMKSDAIENPHAFVMMKLYKTEIKTHQKKMSEYESIKEAKTVSFKPNNSIRNINELGKLVFVNQTYVEPIPERAVNIVPSVTDTINVKSSVDTTDCKIYGIDRFSKDELVIADFANKTVKVIDRNRNQVKRTLKVVRKPWDLAVLRNGRIAAAFTQYILIFCKSLDYQVYKTIKISGESRGITTLSSNKIIATFEHPAKVVVLTYDGDILNTISATTDSGDTIGSRTCGS